MRIVVKQNFSFDTADLLVHRLKQVIHSLAMKAEKGEKGSQPNIPLSMMDDNMKNNHERHTTGTASDTSATAAVGILNKVLDDTQHAHKKQRIHSHSCPKGHKEKGKTQGVC